MADETVPGAIHYAKPSSGLRLPAHRYTSSGDKIVRPSEKDLGAAPNTPVTRSKTTIVIASGRVTVQVEDEHPVQVWPKSGPDKALDVDIPITGKVDATNGDITPSQAQTRNFAEHKRKVIPKKHCPICGEAFEPNRRNQTLCGKPECKKEKQRQYAKGIYARKETKATTPRERFDLSQEGSLGLAENAPRPAPKYRSKCHEAKVKVVTVNGKSHYECLACCQTCDVIEELPPFTDIWNCGACRQAGRSCRLHAELEADGKTPPRFI